MKVLKDLLQQNTASGILLMAATALALLAANTPLSVFYNALIDLPVSVQVGNLTVDKPLLLWINDGLMAGFFFLVGLELKREIREGQLSNVSNVTLPAAGAIGGMAIPAGIYVWLNWGNDIAILGWAIPAATDIAFAMGILALLGSRVPTALKLFLVSLAIIDDIGAIIIIALFYTDDIATLPLIIGAICLPILYVMNRRNVTSTSAYIMIGGILWLATLKSGVHATLAGV
ncbi:MAG: Na+/H+ antiporter NhaA, partial [Sedimentisphaerales bacterium]|nr:Na+/H+ antiporter NhaA [Sedimentisphaerales bacterium]